MENNFDNTPNENEQNMQNEQGGQDNSQPVYTDPNADVKDEAQNSGAQYQYTQSDPYNNAQNSQQSTYAGYRQGEYQNSNYQQYQDNQNYSYYQQQYQNQQGNNYQQQNQNYQNNNYQQQYEDNLNYNIGNNMGYNQNNYQEMDTSPMSMGDWLLTILAAMIPCAGIVLYFVWAFSKTGNVNRRNFCRAQLIIMGVVFVLYLVLFAVFGVALFGTM